MTKRIESDLLPLNKHDLLGFLDEMPPESADVNFDSSQRKYWQDLFARFSYFLGSFDGDNTIFQKWDKHYLERINANVMRYLSLYNVLFCAWENDIIPLAAEYDLDLSDLHPLDGLIEIMSSDWELEEAKNRMPRRPTLRESHNLSLKITPSNLSKIEKSKHPKNRHDKLWAKLWEGLPENYEEIKRFAELCDQAARNSKSPLVKKYFARYDEDYMDYIDIMKKIAKSSTLKNSQTSTKLF